MWRQRLENLPNLCWFMFTVFKAIPWKVAKSSWSLAFNSWSLLRVPKLTVLLLEVPAAPAGPFRWILAFQICRRASKEIEILSVLTVCSLLSPFTNISRTFPITCRSCTVYESVVLTFIYFRRFASGKEKGSNLLSEHFGQLYMAVVLNRKGLQRTTLSD